MRCAVLGSPVKHSLSPVMHRAAYAELGLDWTYEPVEIRSGGLAEFLGALGDDVRGLSVTAPLKREAAAAAHDRSQVVELLGIANTLIREDDRIFADNTDVPGAVNALAESGITHLASARILGAGATAASMAHAFGRIGLRHLELVVRNPDRAVDTMEIARGSGIEVEVHTMDNSPTGPVDLLVSTIPVGAVDGRAETWVAGASAVFDVVYEPWPTALAAAAQAAGTTVVSGLDLLAHQGALQVLAMTGRDVAPQVLRAAALAHLAPY
ncbi:MAG: shikimate dehydrogenase [Aeromicrobium sp.]|uniref:shikimate dehydrogenase n=1 Tax=Aeromicrobium sp. TaxID=1871063 RepID=UPI003C345EAA